jgi:hypothetical protein
MVDVDRAGAIVVQCVIAIDDEDLPSQSTSGFATTRPRGCDRSRSTSTECRDPRIQDALVERAQRSTSR